MCVVAKRDFLRGVHHCDDKYKIALYGAGARLSPLMEKYTTTGEIKALGYEAGGQVLRGYQCEVDAASGVLGWSQAALWKNSTIKASAALIYNVSKGNKAVAVIDFGGEISSTNAPFALPMPPLTAADALIGID